MNTRILFATALVAALPFSVPAQTPAAASAGAPPAPGLSAEFVDLNAPEFAYVRSLGDRAISRIAFSMMNEATTAVARDGAVKAVAICHLKSTKSGGEIVSGMPQVLALKRTSLRIRDNANTPDEADKLALDKINREIKADRTPPKLLLQRIDLAGDKKEWRVYRPIAVAQSCLVCHGSPDSMTPELRAELKKRFPNDEATGYVVGEWRGLIRVTIGDAPAKPAAPAKATPAGKSPKKA